MAELKKDEEEVAEIESCDQGYLNDLKRSLAEQRHEQVVLHIHMVPNPLFVCLVSRWMGTEPMSLRPWLNSRG